MAEALGLSLKAAAGVPGETAADPELEREVVRVWGQVLGVAEVPPGAEFLDLGGDSIGALRVVNRLRASLKVELSMADFLTAATVREQAIVLSRARRT
jgi:acyl carrier protein